MITPKKVSSWYLQFEGSDFGPFSISEVETILRSGKIQGKLFAWQPGQPKWAPIEEIPELSQVLDLVKNSEIGISKHGDKRKHIRVPMIATVRFSLGSDNRDGSPSGTGICRNISVSGMMILSIKSPGYSRALITLTVTPQGLPTVYPFEVQGTVRQVLDGEAGFSVEFIDLPPKVELEIERFIETRKMSRRK